MNLKEIRQLDLKGIKAEIKETSIALAKYKMQIKLSREKNTSFLRKQRVYIAKLNTILNEKLFLNNLDVKEEDVKE